MAFIRNGAGCGLRLSRLSLLGGASVVAIAAISGYSSIARADDVSRLELFGASGRDANIGFINTTSTPGGDGAPISITNSHSSAKEATSTTSVQIGSTGGLGGGGASFLFSDESASAGGRGGDITVVQQGALSANGNQRASASPNRPGYPPSDDPRWELSGGTANLLVYSQGGKGGNGNNSLGAGGAAGSIDLSVLGPIVTEGDRFAAVWARSLGGNAGNGGTDMSLTGVLRGGSGGTASVEIGSDNTIDTSGQMAPGVIAESIAGSGGNRSNAVLASPYISDGGVGGYAKIVNLGTIRTAGGQSIGLIAQSIGGNGGNQGRSGGQPGGWGGNAGTAYIANQGDVATKGDFSAGMLVQAVGGSGGQGGSGVFGGGDGGAAGAGGWVIAANDGTVTTRGANSIGVVAQSVGGGNAAAAFETQPLVPGTSSQGGGSGGDAFLFWGGKGGTGGDGGRVDMTNLGSIETFGSNAYGVLAQSIGGGGGAGGSAASYAPGVSIAVGGNGGGGGDGGSVLIKRANLPNGQPQPTIATHGTSSHGIVAMSVGGSGGNGGSAAAKGAGAIGSISVAVGGHGGNGGKGGAVSVQNDSIITTDKLLSVGIRARSVGGGGGEAGSAKAYALSVATPDRVSVALSFTLGGSGGKGGAGGNVDVGNFSTIATKGTGSTGIEAMSVGGGGGGGGAAESIGDMLGLFANVGASVSIGGSGGGGGSGGTVTVLNQGSVETGRDYARGIIAMSVGGGGGKGGAGKAQAKNGLSWNEAAEAISDGGLPSANSVSVNVAVGGSGGNGGKGGDVTTTNAGRIKTKGANAQAIFAQSVGGGGGDAAGSAGAEATGSGSIAVKASYGGTGGGGGAGGTVTVTNAKGATIETSGEGSAGIFAQSVGGGGGNGGSLASEAAAPENLDEPVGAVFLALADDFLKANEVVSDLFGSDAKKELGEYSVIDKNSGAQQALAKARKIIDIVKILADSDKSWGERLLKAGGTVASGYALDLLKTSIQEAYKTVSVKEGPNIPSIDFMFSLGASGGDGGNGGVVNIANAGTVTTAGANAWGLFGQSIGGGGGVGGTGVSSGTNKINLDVTLGASGGDGGNGGNVTIDNSGSITTTGGAAFGIFAQSVGGGGGVGGAVRNTNSISFSGGFRMGGDAGSSSAGGTVTVRNDGSITTKGREAHGLVAQSIGGGGGTITVTQADPTTPIALASNAEDAETLENAFSILTSAGVLKGNSLASSTGGKVADSTSAYVPLPGLAVSIGGRGAGGGNGGAVNVTQSGAITTGGVGAIGVFGQSVGGGGGFGADGSPAESVEARLSLGGTGGSAGNGGEVKLHFGNGARIETVGDGAYGVLLQSIGGGGGYGGVGYHTFSGETPSYVKDGGSSGNGGAITIDMVDAKGEIDKSAQLDIHTTGKGAHGLYVQSLGGGGGTAFEVNGASAPAQSGSGETRSMAKGIGGQVKITTKGNIVAEGTDSYGIFVQSGVQNKDGSINYKAPYGDSVTISHAGKIQGGSGSGAAIRIDDAQGGSIVLASGSTVSAASGTAILAPKVLVFNSGTVEGNVDLLGVTTGGTFVGQSGSTYRSVENGWVKVSRDTRGGYFMTHGVTDVGGVGRISALDITAATADFVSKSETLIDVTSTPAPGGLKNDTIRLHDNIVTRFDDATVAINVIGGLWPDSFTIASTDGTMATKNLTVTDRNTWSPFTWLPTVANNTLVVAPTANFYAPAGSELTQSEQSIRSSLQQTWNAGGTISATGALIYGDFARVGSAEDYVRAIDSLSAEESLNVGSARTSAARTSMNASLSCPAFEGPQTFLVETDCVWAKVSSEIVSRTQSEASAGYDRDGLSWRLGGQHEIADDWFLGGSAAYTWSSLSDSDGLSQTDGNSFDASLALKHQMGPWLLALSGQLGYGTFDTDRTLAIGSQAWMASGSSDVWTAGSRFRASREFAFPNWYIKPYADVDLLYSAMPAHSEFNDALGTILQFDAASQWNVAFSPNVEFGGRLNIDERTWLRPYATFGATFLANDGMNIAGTLDLGTNNQSFVAESNAPTALLNLSAGLQLYRNESFEVRAEYRADIADDYLAQEASARFAIPF